MFLRPRILTCGDGAISVEFGEAIDPELNGRVLALDEIMRNAPPVGVIETVPTYRSLMVHFDPVTTDYDALERFLLNSAHALQVSAMARRRWKVPVVYGGAFGIDLEDFAAQHGLTVEGVITRHVDAVYRVYMIGFMPGFAYLGGLDPALATPRRTHPRAKIPSGSIIVGGAQAGISSVECPSGWHLLGRTPVLSYLPTRDPIFLFEAGDEIVFERIDAVRWDDLERAAIAGEPVAERVSS